MQHLITEPGGTPSKLHNHPDHEEFFYIQAGEWEFTLEDEVRRVGPATWCTSRRARCTH